MFKSIEAQVENHDAQLNAAFEVAQTMMDLVGSLSDAIHMHRLLLQSYYERLVSAESEIVRLKIVLQSYEERLHCVEERTACKESQ